MKRVIGDILLAWTHWGWLWMIIGLLGYVVIQFAAEDR